MIGQTEDSPKTVSLPSIPTNNLTLFETDIPMSGGNFGNFLISAKRLTHLFISRAGPIDLEVESNLLPGLAVLQLGRGQHSVAAALDLSRLRCLNIEGIDPLLFLKAISGKKLPALEAFTIYNSGGPKMDTSYYHLLAKFIEGLISLEFLTLGVHHDVGATLKAIAKHGRSLETLNLHKLWRGPATPVFQATLLSHLQIVQQSCINVTSLYIRATVLMDSNNEEVKLPSSPYLTQHLTSTCRVYCSRQKRL
jgi:hypothetical protein